MGHGSDCDNNLVGLRHPVRHVDRPRLEQRTLGRWAMSAKIIPWRKRAGPAPEALKSPVYLPALIDGHVTVHALMEGLAAAGLRLQHNPATGQFVILTR